MHQGKHWPWKYGTITLNQVFKCENRWTISKNPKLGMVAILEICICLKYDPGNMVIRNEIRSLDVKIAEISAKIEKLVMEYIQDVHLISIYNFKWMGKWFSRNRVYINEPSVAAETGAKIYYPTKLCFGRIQKYWVNDN